MSDDDLAEVRTINAMVREVMSSAPTPAEVGAAATRQARIDGTSWMGPIVHLDGATTRRIDTEVGPIDLRVVVPDQVDAVYLHIHGGGWVLGAADQQDTLLATIAHGADVAVVSVDYRLAPEHPFPAAPEDCGGRRLAHRPRRHRVRHRSPHHRR